MVIVVLAAQGGDQNTPYMLAEWEKRSYPEGSKLYCGNKEKEGDR